MAAEDDLRSRTLRMREKFESIGQTVQSLPAVVGSVSSSPSNAHGFSPTGGSSPTGQDQQVSFVRSTRSVPSADGYSHNSQVLDCARPVDSTGPSAESLRQRRELEQQTASGWTEPTKPSQGLSAIFEVPSPLISPESRQTPLIPPFQAAQTAQPLADGRSLSPRSRQVQEQHMQQQQRSQQRQPRQAQSQMLGLRQQGLSAEEAGGRLGEDRNPEYAASGPQSSSGAFRDDLHKNARRLILSGNLKIQVYSAKQRQWVPRMLAMNTEKGILGIRGGEKTIHFNISDLQRINQSLPAELLANPPPMDRFASFNFKGPRPLMVFLFESGEVKDHSLTAVSQLCGVPIEGRPPPTM